MVVATQPAPGPGFCLQNLMMKQKHQKCKVILNYTVSWKLACLLIKTSPQKEEMVSHLIKPTNGEEREAPCLH